MRGLNNQFSPTGVRFAMVMYRSSIATGHVSLPVLAITTLFPSLYWSVLLCRTLILTSVLENCKSEHLISLKRKNHEKARRQIVTVPMSNNDADSWGNVLAIFCNNCGVTGSFFTFGLPFMRCALSCIVLTIGDGNPPNSCTHASAFTASSTAVFCF